MLALILTYDFPKGVSLPTGSYKIKFNLDEFRFLVCQYNSVLLLIN